MTSPLRQRSLVAAAAIVFAGAALPVRAQETAPPAETVVVDPELKAIASLYDHGDYETVLTRARARIDRGTLSREELVQLHQYAGLASFNLGDEEGAKRHFTVLLRLDPDFGLDPFSVAPPAVALFNAVKAELEPQLEIIRQQRRVEAERLRQDAEERARRQREDEERRRRLDDLTRQVTVRNVEKRSFLVNFVPFGAGQFQQKRPGMGAAMAASQGVAAITSVVAYFMIESMIVEQKVWVDSADGRTEIKRRGIPSEREPERDAWVLTKYLSAGAFYTLYGFGVADAIYNHQSEVVQTTTLVVPLPNEDAPSDAPAPSPIVPRRDGPQPETPREIPLPPRTQNGGELFLFPTAGGLGAGFHLRF